jgi:YVTN family beta-propeller protein
MKRAAFVTVVVLLGAAGGQWLETTIYLPDSSRPNALCYNAENSRLYCANSAGNNISVIDGRFNGLIRNIPVGRRPSLLCLDGSGDKLYCANTEDDDIAVIDCRLDSVVARISSLPWPWDLCYNPQDAKLYCSCMDNSCIAVIDCVGDTLLAMVPAGFAPMGLAYCPANNSVYCAVANDSRIVVIDGSSNLLVDSIAFGTGPTSLCYNAVENKFYCGDFYGGVGIIDAATNQVLCTIPDVREAEELCYDSLDNCVYCSDHMCDTMRVIDGTGDSVRASIPLGLPTGPLYHNPTNNKLYCLPFWPDSCILVVDCATNQLLLTLPTDRWPAAIAWNPARNRMYVANSYVSSITTYRDSGGAVHEMPKDELRRADLPSVVRGVLVLGAVGSRQNTGHRAELLDISGRKVLDLRSGANDVRALAPGVYFIRKQDSRGRGFEDSRVTKVIITK